jgi:cold shock CspA family protein/ribosome-associated translation inhibitor RaiA
MNIPLEVVFRGVERTSDINEIIEKRTEKLQHLCGHIISLRIAVEKPQLYQDRGNPYRIRLDLRVPPGHELVVRRESSQGDMHDSLPMMLRLAFDAAERQVRKLRAKQRYDVKRHFDTWSMGTVVKKFDDNDYGFIKATGDRDVYFHKNSLLKGDFEKLAVGTVVKFTEEEGANGPQATTVHKIA